MAKLQIATGGLQAQQARHALPGSLPCSQEKLLEAHGLLNS